MLKFLVRSERAVDADGVDSTASAEAFWRSLPAHDPIAVQRGLCDALLAIKGPRGPEVERLEALLVLERRSESFIENLLAEYASPDGRGADRETKARQLIVEVSRAFTLAFEFFYRHIREHTDAQWTPLAPAILAALLKQREIDLLLALFRYEKLSRGRWKDINAIYAFALEQGLERREAAPAATVEHAFVRILLLQLTDSGQLLPMETALARQWIGRWSALLSLAPVEADDAFKTRSRGFRVDLSGSHGLKRPSSLHSIEGRHLQLDTSPLGPTIDEALETMRNGAIANAAEGMERTRQLALLARLKVLFAAEPARMRRRGERTKVESASVRAIIGGLQSIGRILRNESRKPAEAVHAEPRVEEITIGDVSDYTTIPRAVATDVAGGYLPVVGVDGLEPLWQVQDSSESGCLLRGQTLDAEQSLPGCLIALRDHDAPWTVAVVRRLSRIGALVELGVEYIGRNPQRVVLLSEQRADKRGKFVALYLPESAARPRIPIKTLIVPAREYERGRAVTLVSTSGETAVRLKDPIEQQGDFVWTAFEHAQTDR